MKATLTPKQKSLLDFIRGYIGQQGFAPSYREIQQHFHFSSLGSVHKYIKVLKEKGLLKTEKHRSRSLALIETQENTASEGKGGLAVPFVGVISRENFIETFPQLQSLSLPSFMLPDKGNVYLLKANDDSFRNGGIFKGDLLLVETDRSPTDGCWVIAQLSDGETVIQRYHSQGSYVRLEGKDPGEPPLILRSEELSVFGILLSAMRDYSIGG